MEKFKPKKTTDDCYTPPEVYEVVEDWACREYGIDPDKIVRPFYPGGDYESFDYSGGAVVLDNPPFSILVKIQEFYLREGVPFFIFAPTLTCMSSAKFCMRTTHIVCRCNIEYENGAVVNTSFITNLGGDVIARTAPDLTEAVNAKVAELRRKTKKQQPKYDYPAHVVTAAMLEAYSRSGVEFEVRAPECCRVSKLDDQAAHGKTIFGGGLLLSDDAAERHEAAKDEHAENALVLARERAAAERASAHVWHLSERERMIVDALGKQARA